MRGEFFHPGGGDAIVFLDANPRAQFLRVKAGLDGEDIALFEDIVPGRTEVRRLVGEEADAMPQMMKKGTGEMIVEPGLGVGKNLLARHAGTHLLFDEGEHAHHRSMRGELSGSRLAIDGEGAAIVGEIPAISGAKIEDVKLPGLSLPLARRTTGRGALVVVAGGGERFAEGDDRSGLQRVEDLEFIDARSEDLTRRGIHRLGGTDGMSDHGEFVGVFVPPQTEQRGFHIDARRAELHRMG